MKLKNRRCCKQGLSTNSCPYLSTPKARFVVCHTAVMEREDLLKLRNAVSNTEIGGILDRYISNYVTSNACKQREASEIKGMCELWEQIKRIPSVVENMRKN